MVLLILLVCLFFQECKSLIYDLTTWETGTETVGRTLQTSKLPGIHPEILIIHLAVQKA